jgi:hypothetical protein
MGFKLQNDIEIFSQEGRSTTGTPESAEGSQEVEPEANPGFSKKVEEGVRRPAGVRRTAALQAGRSSACRVELGA